MGTLLGGQCTFSSVSGLVLEWLSRNITHHTLHAWAINDVSLIQIGLS